jgi:ribonuclease D
MRWAGAASRSTAPRSPPGDEQLAYAASDVLYLHALKAKLDALLEREGRTELAQAAFRFLPTRARLDVAGWPDVDIFEH